jgi:hypothetical protein
MKKQTKNKIAVGIAIGGLVLGTIFGMTACKVDCDLPHNPSCNEPHCPGDCVQPEVKQQSTTINISVNRTMTINYRSVDDAMPEWWNTLVAAIVGRVGGFADEEDYELTVEYTGNDGFVSIAPGSKKATVSEAYLLTSSLEKMRNDIGTSGGAWMAMNKSNVYLVKFGNVKKII